MTTDAFVQHLTSKLSSEESSILTSHSTHFQRALERWSDVDRQTPALVVLPASEEDVVATVKASVGANIPFVPAIGGHSTWSTIDGSGIVVDLQRFKQVSVDEAKQTVTVRGGVLMKELQVALSKSGQFTAVANNSTVGVIPFFMGGGISSYTPLIGYACENILSAKIIVASGKIVEATEDHNQELLWAIRGAGQLLGLVTELVLRTYPFSVVGPQGIRQLGTILFLADRAAEVCATLAKIVSDNSHVSAGHFMIMNDPSGGPGQFLMVAPQYFGSETDFKATFKPLVDLGPLKQDYTTSCFEAHSDHLDWLGAKGDYKLFDQTGLASIDANNFAKLVDLHQELTKSVPGAERSAFTVEWHTPSSKSEARKTDTAFGLKHVDTWLNILLWSSNPDSQADLLDFQERARAIMRVDTLPEAYISYTNTTRADPIEHRYKDANTIDRLKALKHKWDSTGVFTKELL